VAGVEVSFARIAGERLPCLEVDLLASEQTGSYPKRKSSCGCSE